MSKPFGKTWITHFEQSGFLNSPRYTESIKYFKQFEALTPYVRMFSIGVSPQNRSIECLVVAKNKEFTSAKAKKSRRGIVLIQNGIHAGEIEGKDASMLLLRDILITKEKLSLLDHLILLVIPILNVDGHERVSPFNRPNQNGPKEMGWRTNSWNLNLNRDYLKADTPEIRAFLKVYNEWQPDFFIDNHTTNGADYQYHVTYALEHFGNIDSRLGAWGQMEFLPYMIKQTESNGFLTAPYIITKEEGNLDSGIVEEPALPRLSTGYTAVQNRLGLLVETHSLKPFENRVRSTYAMNVASLEFLNTHCNELRILNEKADHRSSKLKSIPVTFSLGQSFESFTFKGVKADQYDSSITGDTVVRYSDEPIEFKIPYYNSVQNDLIVKVPKGYLIPKEFFNLMEILTFHGIVFSVLRTKKIFSVEEYSFNEFSHAPKPYEGRYCVKVRCNVKRFKYQSIEGMYYVPANQRTSRVIVNLLEPEAPDSFVSWGFFNAWFERKEYAEPYIMEPYAQQMFEHDESIRNAFLTRLETDETFRNDPKARLDFFYERSPFFDQKEKKYPILRVV